MSLTFAHKQDNILEMDKMENVETKQTEKLPLALRVFGALSIAVGVVLIPIFTLALIGFVGVLVNKDWATFNEVTASNQAIVLMSIFMFVLLVQVILFVVLGIKFVRNKRRGAAILVSIVMWVCAASTILEIMIAGFDVGTIVFAGLFIFMVVLHTTLDPALRQERELQRKLKTMEDKSDLEAGMLGRDKTGEGYLKLDFFNMFWIFMVGAFLGLLFETAVCPFLNGRIESRAGLIVGPFSPIYGFGALLMVIFLNRFYNKSPVTIYLVSGFIGAAFEYAVSWFFQFAFGILAWDYSGEFLNIDGRTDLLHFLCWGALGIFFIKLIVPKLLDLINLIPWKWRYSITAICAALMLANGAMTLMAFQSWYSRAASEPADTPIAQFCNEHFDDDFMKTRFATMSIDPSRATQQN